MDQSIYIYGDLFFIFQVLWNGYLIFISANIVNYHLSKWKICAFVLVLSMDTFLFFRWIHVRAVFFIIEWLLIYIIGRSKKLCLALFLISVIANGFWMLAPGMGCAIAIVGITAIMLYIKYIPKSNIYTVYCLNRGKRVKVKALYDTGNSLCLSEGEMVSLVFYEAVKPIIDWNSVKNPRIVSFSSVGNKEGLLLAASIDSFIILEKNIEIKNPYIGIVEQDLSGSGDYQMILHKDIFNGRK